MTSSSVEDYVKAIYLLQQEAPTGEATVVRLAATLGVTKGSVTSMVRKLRQSRLAEAERYGGIKLTPKGRKLAVDMIRRHRLIEVFLVETLGFDWSEVHEEAERLEHAVSLRLLDRLDEFLGRPAIDPHGDPIPDPRGRMPDDAGVPLCDFEIRQRGQITRITDQASSFLRFAAAHNLKPGTGFMVMKIQQQAELLWLRPSPRGADPVTLSFAAASKILAEPTS